MMTEPTQAPVSDANLITATRSGDAQAYGILYERHAAAARRVAGQLVGGLTWMMWWLRRSPGCSA